jgi:hypothetical protein
LQLPRGLSHDYKDLMRAGTDDIEQFIAEWRETGGSELANTQLFINGLANLLGVDPPRGAKADDTTNDYVFERRVFQDNGDGTESFGRIDCYKRDCFVLEAKQGSEADRSAAEEGKDDLDLFGQTAKARVARGTARRGTPSWAKAMQEAKGQAERYAKALPADHGWPPFLLVSDVGYCIEVYADFTGTGKAYAQFPDRAGYRIMLEDLRDEKVRERLRAIWTDPKSLDPASRAAKVTREIADLLATLSRRLERHHDPETVSGFLMRLLFTMFAEDTEVLLPKDSFKTLLRSHQDNLENLPRSLEALWQAMDKGEFSAALAVQVRKFNGYLFKDTQALPLDADELKVLIEAADKVWTDVEPAIFGTLLERALNPKERAKLGAHYTPRAYVERLIGPTIMEPLRADWNGVRAAAAELIGAGKAKEAKDLVEDFHSKLAQTRVLDPACGTGNFLYVAMARMKELEGEVLDLLIELGDDQYVAEITGHTITPENFLGIEVNPRAAAIAQLVLWIGYLQWHFRVNGKHRAPPEPILDDIRTIEKRDALIEFESRQLVRDEHGEPLTRWDGEAKKVHPVTGKEVPDEDTRVEVYRYVKPRAAKWPKADFIVGNPPFHGARRIRGSNPIGYIEAVRSVYPEVPEHADFVMYWWHKAALAVQKRAASQFGFITTKSITQTFSRSVMSPHLSGKDRVSLILAIPNHPWIDESDGADVRVAFTVAAAGRRAGTRLEIVKETPLGDGAFDVEFCLSRGLLSAGLRAEVDLQMAVPLRANAGLSCVGFQLTGKGFTPTEEVLSGLNNRETESYLFNLLSAREIVQRRLHRKVVDVCEFRDENDLKLASPDIYQYLYHAVKPERDINSRKSVRERWWVYGEARNTFRPALEGLQSQIVTPLTAKHRIFVREPMITRPDSTCVIFAFDDNYILGVLSSRIHVVWALANGGRLGVGDDPRYLKAECFDPFPFPAQPAELLRDRIAAEAAALDELRKRVLGEQEDLTLTKIYNVLEALKEGRQLNEAERDIHDRGLVTLMRQHHDAIDTLVAKVFDWPVNLSDDQILTRLVALNAERAAEEAKGFIRWLRPEYQAPNYQPPLSTEFDLGGTVTVLLDNFIPWPGSLPEQVSAVQSILATAQAPLAPQDVARAFKGKRAASVRPVLDALTAIGQARRLADGRYAA